VGSFQLRNEVVQDEAQSKIVRLTLEGEGLLSLFDFPLLAGSGYRLDPVSSSATASLHDRRLQSMRAVDFEVTPGKNTTDIVLQPIRLRQLDPEAKHFTTLSLPPLRLTFRPESPAPPLSVPLPEFKDPFPLTLWALFASSGLLFVALLFCPKRKARPPRLRSLLKRKNPELQISKSSALQLYQQMMKQMIQYSETSDSLIEILEQHLPAADWQATQNIFRNLEWTAFAPSKTAELTYRDLKDACSRVEKEWLS
jgi:hypothetical protein